MSTTAPTPPGPREGPGALPPTPGVYDEMLDPTGAPRPHWAQLAGDAAATSASTSCCAASAAGERGCSTRTASSTTPTGTRRPPATSLPRAPQRWLLDPCRRSSRAASGRRSSAASSSAPSCSTSCSTISTGRATLLRRRPAPARGRLRPRRLPARSATGSGCPTPQQLFATPPTSAATPQGSCLVLSDRTQAPSGAGYALENRDGHLARVPEPVPRLAGAPAGAVLPRRCASALQDAAPARRRRPAHRGAHAGAAAARRRSSTPSSPR